MAQRILLGIGTGTIVAALSWRGNSTANLVSVFPDGLTFAMLAALLSGAVLFELRRTIPHDRRACVRAGVTIATAAGAVLGAAVVALVFIRLSQPSIGLLMFGFLIAIGASVPIGALAAAFASRQVQQAV